MSQIHCESASSASLPSRPVTINIGGEKLIAVSPSLFDILGESKMSAIFSGRWETLRDSDGNIFMDYSPEVFMPLVEWLRHRRDASPRSTIRVRVEPQYRDQWIRMMRSFSVEAKQLLRAGVSKQELLKFGFPEEELREQAVEERPAPAAERKQRLDASKELEEKLRECRARTCPETSVSRTRALGLI
mmetsp:Transcript_55603/g.130553  ORF Transcript_55603/g.130553 Transcript_55603/m.130553 type:complete len:188 (+) Transcript_55603:28-591(+)